MKVYGYAKALEYAGDGMMFVQVRIPNIHGPEDRSDYNGQPIRNYTYNKDLPWYPANILSSTPVVGDVVELQTTNEDSTEFIVTGITGGGYGGSWTNIGE